LVEVNITFIQKIQHLKLCVEKFASAYYYPSANVIHVTWLLFGISTRWCK